MPGKIRVEVAFALPERQLLVSLELADGATVGDAVEASGLSGQFPAEGIGTLPTGVWGRVTARDHALSDGDRVEVYRPLHIDPREARRRLAEAGKTMRAPRET